MPTSWGLADTGRRSGLWGTAIGKPKGRRMKHFSWESGFDKSRIVGKEKSMSEWLHSLPTLWMALLVFGFTFLVTAAIYAVVAVFAVGERARSFKAISPGLLSPFGLSLHSPQPRFGPTTKRPKRKSIARLAR
jgi:hypothetical protein